MTKEYFAKSVVIILAFALLAGGLLFVYERQKARWDSKLDELSKLARGGAEKQILLREKLGVQKLQESILWKAVDKDLRIVIGNTTMDIPQDKIDKEVIKKLRSLQVELIKKSGVWKVKGAKEIAD